MIHKRTRSSIYQKTSYSDIHSYKADIYTYVYRYLLNPVECLYVLSTNSGLNQRLDAPSYVYTIPGTGQLGDADKHWTISPTDRIKVTNDI